MIVATAGHVDHGKSTLVRLLTGTDPDRWEEEKRRGLTIDLGFARFQRDGIDIGFVDVPGHQRYLSNMLAGCGAVDVVLLVVSAREGWMAQTEEHTQILDLLGVEHGVVALTHADTVDDGTLARRTEQVTARLKGTGLVGAEVVATASGRPDSIERLAGCLVALARGSVATIDADRPRLWIDRSFALPGSGRVVTGTVSGGTLLVGDEVDLIRAERSVPARVRSLHVFGGEVAAAPPATRVGIGIAGARDVPERGWAITRRDHWTGGRRWQVAIFAVAAGRTDRFRLEGATRSSSALPAALRSSATASTM